MADILRQNNEQHHQRGADFGNRAQDEANQRADTDFAGQQQVAFVQKFAESRAQKRPENHAGNAEEYACHAADGRPPKRFFAGPGVFCAQYAGHKVHRHAEGANHADNQHGKRADDRIILAVGQQPCAGKQEGQAGQGGEQGAGYADKDEEDGEDECCHECAVVMMV